MASFSDQSPGEENAVSAEDRIRAVDLRKRVFIINCRLYMIVGAASIIIGAGLLIASRVQTSNPGITHDPAMNFIAGIMIIFGLIRIAVARKQLEKVKLAKPRPS